MEEIFIQFALILLTAFIVSYIARAFNQPIIIGYIVAGIIILGLLGYSLVNSMNPYKDDAVTVSGQSTIEVTPDLITVYFNIEEVAETSKEAEDAVSEKVNRLTNNIIAEGFSRRSNKKFIQFINNINSNFNINFNEYSSSCIIRPSEWSRLFYLYRLSESR